MQYTIASAGEVVADSGTERREGGQLTVGLRLSLLWTSLMFLYVYGDYFGLYRPGAVMSMNEGLIRPLGQATPGVLLGVTIMMAIPSLMIAGSALLPANISRIANIATGFAYTAIMALTMPGAPLFYQFLGVIEMALTLTIAIVAWRWPRSWRA